MNDRVLEGKTVLMTGAGRGMGRSMSIALAAAGAKVAMIDIDEDVLQEAAKEAEDAGGQGILFRGDPLSQLRPPPAGGLCYR